MKRKANPKSILPGLMRLLRAFRPQIRRQRSLLLLAFVSVSAGILFQVLEPWPVKFIYDHIFLRSGHHLRGMPFHLDLAAVSLDAINFQHARCPHTQPRQTGAFQ